MKRIIFWLMGLSLVVAGYPSVQRQNNAIYAKSIPSHETDEMIDACWHLLNLGCENIWKKLDEMGKKPAEDVVVAVIDTGLDMGCNELTEALWCNETERDGIEGVDDDGNGYVDDIYGLNLANRYHYMTDSDGHGTQMAGVIAMRPNNGGAVGVAYGAKIMPIKVSTDKNYDFDTIIEALHYAVEMGADIINMSFATYTYSEEFEKAIREAAKSCVLVAAAGNEECVTEGDACDKEKLLSDGYEMMDTYPASWDCCIGVMAYDRNEELADYSNWDQSNEKNQKYNIIAPGSQILTVTKSNKYVTDSGTSYATAMVSASVAILKGITKDKYRAEELKEHFLSAMQQRITYCYDGKEFFYPKCSVSDFISDIENSTGSAEKNTGSTATAKKRKLPAIKNIKQSKNKLKIKIKNMSCHYTTKLKVSQKRKGKHIKLTFHCKKKTLVIKKSVLKKKKFKNGKMMITLIYKEKGKKAVKEKSQVQLNSIEE